MASKKRVLFLCTGNSARSQMAEGLLRNEAGDKYDVMSAGTEPVGVRPEAIEAMKEIGVDITQHRSKSVEEFNEQHFDHVITVCEKARENCPVFLNADNRLAWDFDDPAAATGGEEERMRLYRRVRDEILQRIRLFVLADKEYA